MHTRLLPIQHLTLLDSIPAHRHYQTQTESATLGSRLLSVVDYPRSPLPIRSSPTGTCHLSQHTRSRRNSRRWTRLLINLTRGWMHWSALPLSLQMHLAAVLIVTIALSRLCCALTPPCAPAGSKPKIGAMEMLTQRVEASSSLLCVGLDPHMQDIGSGTK